MSPWLIVAVALGALATVIQQLRLNKAKGVADAYASRVKDVEAKLEARDGDINKLETVIATKNRQLDEVQEVCRANDDPDAVRARLRLLFDPTGTASGGVQQSLPLVPATPSARSLVRGGEG